MDYPNNRKLPISKEGSCYLKNYQGLQELQKTVLETIEECEHWKYINERFVQKLCEKGVMATLIENSQGWKEFTVYGAKDEFVFFCFIREDYWCLLKNKVLEFH